MGDRLTEDENPKQTSPTPYGDIFDELAPHYLLMGMTWDEYWDGEYGMKKACREAYKMRIENEQRMTDTSNWYMGQYIMAVLQCVPLLVGGLNVKETTQLPSYPDKPFLEKAEAEKKEEHRKKAEEDRTMAAMALFQAGIEKFNKRFEKEQKAKATTSGQ